MPDTNASHLIRGLRKRMGLTQEKLAARLGVAFPTLNRWENGHTRPSPLALRQIESLLSECAADDVGMTRDIPTPREPESAVTLSAGSPPAQLPLVSAPRPHPRT